MSENPPLEMAEPSPWGVARNHDERGWVVVTRGMGNWSSKMIAVSPGRGKARFNAGELLVAFTQLEELERNSG